MIHSKKNSSSYIEYNPFYFAGVCVCKTLLSKRILVNMCGCHGTENNNYSMTYCYGCFLKGQAFI